MRIPDLALLCFGLGLALIANSAGEWKAVCAYMSGFLIGYMIGRPESAADVGKP